MDNMMNVQNIRLDSIKPYWRNPRHYGEAVGKVKDSIRNYGYRVPIVLDKHLVIVTGHVRYKALRELGYDEVDCVIADHLTEQQAREFRIADNKISELSSWDIGMLQEELERVNDIYRLQDFGFHAVEVEPLDEGVSDMMGQEPLTEAPGDTDEEGDEEYDWEHEHELICPSCYATHKRTTRNLLGED